MEFPKKDNFIGLDALAEPFAENIAQHIKKNDRQATATKSQFLDACRKFNNAKISKDELVKETRKHGPPSNPSNRNPVPPENSLANHTDPLSYA